MNKDGLEILALAEQFAEKYPAGHGIAAFAGVKIGFAAGATIAAAAIFEYIKSGSKDKNIVYDLMAKYIEDYGKNQGQTDKD